jgi:CheY-like chemotaxis protein
MRTLLLADDSITVQRVIALTFAAEQIQVITVGDGQQAMDKMAALRPDIVLAGTTLPQVSGYDLARFMRGKAELRKVPVLLLTGAFETVDEARLVSSGANGVLEKPVEPTVVINRVKELLGMKPDEKPAATSRLVTPADGPAEKRLPAATPPRAVTSTRGVPTKWDHLRNQSLEQNARSVEDASSRSDDYLDTLDAAFDTLDQQLSGRAPTAKSTRNPSGPLGQSAGAADPRSPGRTPSSGATGNPVFEVDDDWFGSGESPARTEAKAGRREIVEDLRDPDLQPPPAAPRPPAATVFEVDDDWFAEDERARAEKQVEAAELAKEMGIHEVELPDAAPAARPASDLDFTFGIEDFKAAAAPPPAPPAPPPVKSVSVTPPLVAAVPKTAPPAPVAAPAHVAPPRPLAPIAPAPAPPPVTAVADDFAALLAFERGERAHPPAPPPPEIQLVTPEVTDEMLDQIASRVADRLSAGPFGSALTEAVTAALRETVRGVVSQTSERLIRDTVPEVVAQTSERMIRDAVPSVVAETSQRVVRDTVPAVTIETAERVVRETVRGVVAETSERLVRESVPAAVSELSERLVRDSAPGVLAETAERLVRGSVRAVVSETSERLVRDEIDRIKSKKSV